jgi:hypothetical protein
MRDFFVFIDGLNLYCNNGNKTKILKKDLKEAKKRGMTESDIKIAAYTLLTNTPVLEDYLFEKTHD